jgi:hypothetical protein
MVFDVVECQSRLDLVLYTVVIDVRRDDPELMAAEDSNDEDRLGAEYAVAI